MPVDRVLLLGIERAAGDVQTAGSSRDGWITPFRFMKLLSTW